MNTSGLTEDGFSVRKRRPVPQNTAGREEIERYAKEAARKIVSFHRRGHALFCLDACTIVNSPAPRYGILSRGERDTTCASRLRKGVHVLGAMGSESVEIDYPENLKSEGVIVFLRRLYGKYGRILAILDNAGPQEPGHGEVHGKHERRGGAALPAAAHPAAQSHRDAVEGDQEGDIGHVF